MNPKGLRKFVIICSISILGVTGVTLPAGAQDQTPRPDDAANVQNDPTTQVHQQRGDIEQYISEFKQQIPDEEGQVSGKPGVVANFEASDLRANAQISHAMEFARVEGNLQVARDIVKEYGYGIIEYRDTGRDSNRDYLILREARDRRGVSPKNWGMYIFAKSDSRGSTGTSVSIQVPHPVYDGNTAALGIRSFIETNADSYFIAGIHRYRTEASKNRSTWGNADSSDMARNNHSLFLQLSNDFTRPWMYSNKKGLHPVNIVQIHGFSDKEFNDEKWAYNPKASYPQIVLSNGDAALQGSRPPILDQLSEEFWKRADKGNKQRMTTGVYNGWEYKDLAATTNIEGAAIRARNDGSQFIHIEADFSILVTDDWANARGINATADRQDKYQRFGRKLNQILVHGGNGVQRRGHECAGRGCA